MIVRESYISNLVIYLQYFYIFVFANDRKCKQINMYIYILKKNVQILSLVSYALRLFFQRKKKKHEYMQTETKVKMYRI